MNASNKSPANHDDLSAQVEALRKDLTELAATVKDDMTDGIEQAARKVRQSGRDATKEATKAVRDNPLAAVGIAAGFGLIIGLILHKS